MPVAPLPSWLARLLEPPPPPEVGERRALPSGVEATAYGRAALEGLAEEMRATAEGARNDRLVRVSYRAGRLAAGGEFDEELAREILLDAALGTGLDEREAQGVIARGFLAGEQYPIARPER